MKIQYLLVLIITLLTFTASASVIIENNVTSNDSFKYIELNLDNDVLRYNEIVKGSLNLFLNETVSPDEKVQLELNRLFGSTKTALNIKDILDNLSIQYTIEPKSYVTSSRSFTTTLNFNNGGEQSIAVRLPFASTPTSIDMDISAPSSSTLNEVKIDVNDNGNINWYYLGDFDGWANYFVRPAGLEEFESLEATINDNTTMLCELIDLPYSINFNLTAKYKKLNDNGDLWAVILNIPFLEQPEYPSSDFVECDLPELTEFGWGSCELQSDYGISGLNFVCIYSKNQAEDEQDLYKIKVESGSTDTAYSCTKSDEIYCTKQSVNDYFIKIKGAKYTKVLNKAINFQQWEIAPNSILKEFWKILGSPNTPLGVDFTPTCNENECTIRLKFTANGTGSLTISNLKVSYTLNDNVFETSEIFSLEEKPELITHVSNTNLNESNITITIPLELFNITIPESNQDKTFLKLKAIFQDYETEKNITGLAEGILIGSKKRIDEAKTALLSLKDNADERIQHILEILTLNSNINKGLTELDRYNSLLAAGETPELQTEINNFIETLPKEIQLGVSIKDIGYIEPDNINLVPELNNDNNEIYFYQDKAKIVTEVVPFSLTLFSGAIQNYALIRKTIEAKEDLDQFDIYEIVDRSVADNVQDYFSYEETPSIISNNPPTVKWFVNGLPMGSVKTINYIIETEFSPSIEKFKTILVPVKPSEPEDNLTEPDYECGDGICTTPYEDEIFCPEDCVKEKPFPWLTIIIILVIGLSLISYIIFYKGKYSLKNLFKKKSPFRSNKELNSVIAYIKNSRLKKMSDIQTKKRLLDQGWKSEQVDYAFKVLDTKKSVNIKPMQEYIKSARAKGFKDAFIKKVLLSKGWDEELVNKELSK